MNFAAWKLRGFNNPSHVTEVRDFVRRQQLSFVGLLETKLCLNNEGSSQRSIFSYWIYVVIYGSNGVDRIQVYWDLSRVGVDVIDSAS